MDTRTRTRPRPEAANAAGADGGELLLNTVKVPSDPTRLNTTTASFRVRFTPPAASLIDASLLRVGSAAALEPVLVGAGAGLAGGVPIGAVAAMPRRRPRVAPITWTGQLDLAVPGVTPGVPPQGLSRARELGLESTQPMTLADFAELDALDGLGGSGGVGGTEGLRRSGSRVLGGGGVGPAVAAPAGSSPGSGDDYDSHDSYDGVQVFEPASRRAPLPEPVEGVPAAQHHAWHPGKRVDLGLVLLPLRVFLGLVSLYAGFSKLCDPVYFDGGARGSMMHWLHALHPWSAAEPLLAFAMAHPVGAGLAVAFVQINVGVLAILGLWQRACAAVAMLLAFALLVTVSWRTVPVYDTPEIIYLAAWSPLLLAGAPLFSLDGWLHLEAWRRLGEHARVQQLRRRVVRRGVVLATVVIGGTLVVGSALGEAVRAEHLTTTTTTVPSDTPSPSASQTLPTGVWPTGVLPVPAGRQPGAPAAGQPAQQTSATPSASASHKHRAPSGARGGVGTTGGSGGGAPVRSHNPAPAPSSTGPGGVIGGLLGG